MKTNWWFFVFVEILQPILANKAVFDGTAEPVA